ncbi:MAG: hypothetical protein KatS3mg112_0871 [Thermogutta sp.]|nr:MAG: hypothetical protein KatS3mg112_0871 [Thermogutta sp.]
MIDMLKTNGREPMPRAGVAGQIMRALKQGLLPVYYLSTIAFRKWLRQRLAEKGRVPISVLMYHRISRDCPASWCTSLAAFRRHLVWLQRNCTVLKLAQVQESLLYGRWASRPAAAITFDDGYADNLRALADLLEFGMPFTYFVTVENIRTGKPFEHDLAQGYQFPPNTPTEIRALAEAGVDIGSHGWTHAEFHRLSPGELYRQLDSSKKWLEDLIGQPVRAVSVPFGRREHVTPAVILAARRAGYKIVCSAYGGYNLPFRHRFHILRFAGDNCLWRLRNRLTVDPRLLRRTLTQYMPGDAEWDPDVVVEPRPREVIPGPRESLSSSSLPILPLCQDHRISSSWSSMDGEEAGTPFTHIDGISDSRL